MSNHADDGGVTKKERLMCIVRPSALQFPPANNLLPRDGEVLLIESAIPAPDADRLFARLMDVIVWDSKKARIMGREVTIPRQTAWYGDGTYTYSGIRNDPAPWIEELLEVKAIAEQCAGTQFNSVLANKYRYGRDSVAWHADDGPGMGANPVIASISLGAVRRFRMRHKMVPDQRVAIDLTHGSCLVMAGTTQRFWQHGVPKTARAVGPRINLTFRSSTCPRQSGLDSP